MTKKQIKEIVIYWQKTIQTQFSHCHSDRSSKNEIKKIVKKYADKLKAEKYPFNAIYLFGSFTQGKAKKWSDIDVAVVSDKLKRNLIKNELFLWQARRDIDSRIEPHGFTVKDFQDDCDPMAYEIRKTGIKIA